MLPCLALCFSCIRSALGGCAMVRVRNPEHLLFFEAQAGPMYAFAIDPTSITLKNPKP